MDNNKYCLKSHKLLFTSYLYQGPHTIKYNQGFMVEMTQNLMICHFCETSYVRFAK